MKPWRRPVRAAFVVFAIGAVLSVLGGRMWAARGDELATQHFNTAATRIVAAVTERLNRYEYGLRGVRGAVLATGVDTLRRDGLDRYTASRDIDTEFPGARGMGVIWRVPVEQESTYLRHMRMDGRPDFSVRALNAHDDERYVISYIEPLERNGPALGLDIGSEATRRRAADASMLSGRATLTGPITLVQATGKPLRSFLLLLPIYRGGITPATRDERVAAAVGWSYAPLLIDEVLDGIVLGSGPSNSDATLTLTDRSEFGAPVFYASPGSEQPPAQARLERRAEITVHGRVWGAELRATPGFVKRLDRLDPGIVAGVGVLLSALLAMLAHVSAQAAVRSAQVRAEQARRAAMMLGSSDAMVAQDLEGRITDWNPAAQRLFGYTSEQVLGRNVAELLLPAERAGEDAMLRAAVDMGEQLSPIDTTRLRSDGTEIEVSVTIWPIFSEDHRCIGFTKAIRDIGEARRAERAVQELNQSLERQVHERTAQLDAARHDLQTILDAVPSMIGYWDRELRNRVANRAYEGWLGTAPGAMRGRHMGELFGPDFLEANRPYIDAVLRGEAQTFERKITSPDGRESRHALAHYLPHVQEGSVRGFYVLVHDVTEITEGRLRLAAALRENEALLRTLHTHAIVSVADRSGRIVDVNEGFCRISGYSREELIGKDHRIVNSGTHPREFWVEMWGAIGRGQPWRAEVCNRAKDGSLYWVDSIVAPFVDERNSIEKYISIRFDITAAKQQALRLVETSSLLNSVLESATEVAVIAVSPDGRVSVFNRGAERMLGYGRDEVVGVRRSLEFHDQDELRARAAEAGKRLGRKVHRGLVLVQPELLGRPQEWTYVRKDGSRLSVALSVTAMHGEQGQVLGYVGVAHDITRQKEVEQSLREAVQRAHEASRAKSQFLANMSHEIRTPLNAVLGLTYLLARTSLDAEQADCVTKIRLAGKSLLAVINDILDVSKIEAGELHLDRAAFDLRALLAELFDVMQVHAQAKGVGLKFDVPEQLPDVLEGDAPRLGQILTNLLSNAIKFTERGGVRLEVREMDRDGESIRLRLTVHDSGIGIGPDAQARLFEPFVQADDSTTRRFGGTGLGLSIVRRLASMMGGSVGLFSAPGVGSEFWVDLPFRPADPRGLPRREEVSRAPTELLSGVRVLIVDDSIINLQVAQRVLEHAGASVELADDGQRAVERLQHGPQDFDVVLMDVQMPVLDGYAATRHIRGALGLSALPIVALSAGAMSSERQRAAEAGMDDFISKPFDPPALLRCILRHGAPKGVAVARADEPPRAPRLPAAPSAGWPEIAGIDGADVRLRLGGDIELFRMLLSRMLAEFGELADPDPASLPEHAARLHKLRGSAGSLGARELHRIAGDAEAACRDGDAAAAAGLVALARGALRALAQALPPEFMRAADEPAPDAPPAPPPDPAELAALIGLLRQQSLDALERFRALSPGLRGIVDEAAFEALRQQVEGLQFAPAAQLLERLQVVQRPHEEAAG